MRKYTSKAVPRRELPRLRVLVVEDLAVAGQLEVDGGGAALDGSPVFFPVLLEVEGRGGGFFHVLVNLENYFL